MEADATAARRWAKASTDRPQDMGRDFLQLRKLGKKVITITPDIRKGGPWIRKAGGDNTSFARLCRCILNHAPIGSYYRWFNIQEPHGCPAAVLLARPAAVLLARPAHTSSRTARDPNPSASSESFQRRPLATAPIATPIPPKSEPESPPKDLLTAAAAALSPPSKPDACFQTQTQPKNLQPPELRRPETRPT
ncbi:hypothetical protein GALMADRAFT_148682 [Galerina marginata CBS 339.88]|uniref:Uncharacterized protein n=1 Tax=Galerina marginata (strain CBS 339.88) TaxID=685588 RepID=A0A067S6G7_GALM3|nr:hypothetical protein GALMADRAFT_148682 [Galerina marginata CBS 339.88]